MKKTLLKTLVLGCFALLVAFTIAADLTGHWTGTLPIPGQGDFPLSYNFKVDGSKLTGTAAGPNGEVAINDGKIDGNKFSFNVNVNDMSIPHTGTCYQDSVGLDVELNGSKIHTTLKRAN